MLIFTSPLALSARFLASGASRDWPGTRLNMPGGAHESMKAWEPEEDQLIIDLVSRLGFKWKHIIENFPGRTTASLRNRYSRIKKGEKMIAEGANLKNRCHACGELKRGHVCRARLKDPQGRLIAAVVPAKQTSTASSGAPSAAAAAPAAPPPVAQLKTNGVSVEGGLSADGEPNIPLVLKDLFPNDTKALEEAKEWMKERKDPSLVAGHLASLSEAVEAQVKSMQSPPPLSLALDDLPKVTMPLSAYLASQSKKAEQAREDAPAPSGPREEGAVALDEGSAQPQ